MQCKRTLVSAFSVTLLAMTTHLPAEEPALTATSPKAGGPTSQQYVPLEDYRALKRELDDLKQHVYAQDRGMAPSTSQPSPLSEAKAQVEKAASAQSGSSSGFFADNNVDQTFKTLFAPRTEKEYFSKFELMNPAHIRPILPMEIGSYDDLRLYMGLQTVGRVQALSQHNVYVNGIKQPTLNPDFQDPFANLSFLANVGQGIDVYFDLYVASRPHPNTMYAHEGYLLFHKLPAPLDSGAIGDVFNYINVKVGAFDLDFGDGNFHRSNNAFVQRNPLIGNPLVDPNVEEIGGEVYSVKGPVYWLFGMGSGTTTEHFDAGAQPSFHGKIWGNPMPDLRLSLSAYHVDLSRSGAMFENSDLYAAGRSGAPFGGVFGGGDDPGSLQPAAGKAVSAVQGDITWNRWPFEVYSNVGWTQDTDTNGPLSGHPSERWLYGSIGPVYHITPAFYLAARYSLAAAQSVGGVKTSGWVDRGEIGGGYWLTNDVLIKVEGVYQQYHGFNSTAGTVSGVTAGRHPGFQGALVEVSWSL